MLRLQYQQIALPAVPSYVSEGNADRNIWNRPLPAESGAAGGVVEFYYFLAGMGKGIGQNFT